VRRHHILSRINAVRSGSHARVSGFQSHRDDIYRAAQYDSARVIREIVSAQRGAKFIPSVCSGGQVGCMLLERRGQQAGRKVLESCTSTAQNKWTGVHCISNENVQCARCVCDAEAKCNYCITYTIVHVRFQLEMSLPLEKLIKLCCQHAQCLIKIVLVTSLVCFINKYVTFFKIINVHGRYLIEIIDNIALLVRPVHNSGGPPWRGGGQ
jgi:hypothetical protein